MEENSYLGKEKVSKLLLQFTIILNIACGIAAGALLLQGDDRPDRPGERPGQGVHLRYQLR